jgi:hypothetical protein
MAFKRTAWFKRNGSTSGWFRPTGALRPNRVRWSGEPAQAARVIVGFNVGEDPRWTMGDLMALVREIRQEQGAAPAASFLFQRGIYAHEAGGPIVEEDGAQVIILNLTEQPPGEFERDVRRLAEKLATDMEQEEVIVEMQLGGIPVRVYGIGP